MNTKKRTLGYSLLELLIAMSLGVFVVGTTLSFFETTRKTQKVQNELSEVRENAQFALDTIKDDIQLAGFYGCATRGDENSLTNTLNDPSNFKWNFSQAIHGSEFNFDKDSSTPKTWDPPLDGTIDDADWGDTITLRHANRREFDIVSHSSATDAIETSSTNNIKQNDYVLATDCEHSSIFQKTNPHSSATNRRRIEHDAGASNGDLAGNINTDLGKKYSNTAKLMKLESLSYFIAESPEGIPTLYRKDSSRNSEQIISGITDMQIQYGVDTNEDNAIDDYYTADDVQNNSWWDKVLIVQLRLKAEGYRDDSGTKITFSNQSNIEFEVSSAINLRNRLP